MLVLLCGVTFAVSAEVKDYGCFNSLSLGASVGTSGVDIHLATPVGNYFSVCAEAVYMPGFTLNVGLNADVTTGNTAETCPIDLTGGMERFQGGVLVKAYPVSKFDFYLTLGVYFGGKRLVKIKGHSDKLQQAMQTADKVSVIIGDYEVPVSKDGSLTGGLEMNPVRPYFGIGYGREVPSNRWGFMIEVGLQYDGKAKPYSTAGEIIKTDVEHVNDKFSKVIYSTVVYPVLKVGFNFRAF